MNVILAAIIDLVRKNPNSVTIKEFLENLNDEFKDYKESILNMTFGELCGINPKASERDIYDLLYQNRKLIIKKSMNEICEIIGCNREDTFKAVMFLKEDTSEKIKIEQTGAKKGAKYTVIEK